MKLELSNQKFTPQDDIFPTTGKAEIVNSGNTITLEGDDIITGYGETLRSVPYYSTLAVGIFNESGGTINTGAGADKIDGYGGAGVVNAVNATINMGDQNDTVSGFGGDYGDNFQGIQNFGTINMGTGSDLVIGNANGRFSSGVNNNGLIDTAEGDDNIVGSGLADGIGNGGTINTGSGNDNIYGSSNDAWGIYNAYQAVIQTGDGEDSITGISKGNNAAGILNYESATIDTGNSDDTIIGEGIVGIRNNGTINTGGGNDYVQAIKGFDGTGTILLGDNEDYIVGFGNGNFKGGSGYDILELTSGTYNVSLAATGVNLISNGATMNTSEFELLVAGKVTYDFTSLSNGQSITVI
jgi:hypothetical protein